MLRITLHDLFREISDYLPGHAQLPGFVERFAKRIKPSREFADESFVGVFFLFQFVEHAVHDLNGVAELVSVLGEDKKGSVRNGTKLRRVSSSLGTASLASLCRF